MLALRTLPLALALTLATPAQSQCDPSLDNGDSPGIRKHGFSTAASGDWGIAGSPWDGSLIYKGGAASVFQHVAGAWLHRQQLLPADPGERDHFGNAVAIGGNWAFVGAPSAHSGGYRRGAVYVFRRKGDTYHQVQKLQASDGMNSDEFGYALSMDGDRLAIGARYADAPGAANAGAAYIFERTGGKWTEAAKVVASDPAPIDYFGQTLALSGDVLAVGAWGNDDFGTGTGAVYTYRASQGWSLEQKLLSHDADVVDYFGYDVALEGGVLVAGAPGWDGGLKDQGAVFVFRYAGNWQQTQYLPGVHTEGQFGHALDLDGGLLAVSAVTGSGLTADTGDGAYLIDNGNDFFFAGRLLAHDGDPGDRYGESIAISEGRLLVGAPGESSGGKEFGATYAYEVPFLDSNLDGIPDDCASGIHSFCPCDSAPCGPSSPDGCTNSTGKGGALEHLSGTTSVAADDLVLRAKGLPVNQFGLCFMGPSTIDNAPLGDGLRCVDSPLYRFGIRSTGSAGRFDSGPGLVAYGDQAFDSLGHIFSGQTWYFQAWYRDPGGPCGAGSNLTSALAVTFEP